MADKKLTRKEFDDKIKELIKSIQEAASAFADDSKDRQLERISRSKHDLVYFAQTYFPHYCSSEFADFHVEELNKFREALDTKLASIVAHAWFRGSGKSTLIGIILPLWAAITKRSRFSIFTGADQNLSRERTVAQRLELIYNGRLRYDYPEAAMEVGQGEETDFESPMIARFLALGYKQAIRGKVYRRHRPRLIIVDDLESHLDTNPEIADKKYKYVVEEAFGAFGPEGGLIIWLGNLTNSSSALHHFIERCDTEPTPYTRYRIIKAITESGKSAWPQAYPIESLNAKKAVMGKSGFDRHFMMKPSIDGSVFKEDWLRFYNPWSNAHQVGELGLNIPLPTAQQLRDALTVSYCDPSLGGGEGNDYKSIITVAFWSGIYFIVDTYVRKASIIDMLHYMYELDGRFRSKFYMEQNFWQRIIWQFLPEVAVGKKYMLPISGVENRLKKEERILSLEPLFQWGHVINTTVGKDYQLLKEQLLGFPNANYDDAPDALAGAIARFKDIATANKYETIERGPNSNIGMFL